MGAGASSTLKTELDRPLDGSDVRTPRGNSSIVEVQRLRTLLLAQEAEHLRQGEVLDPDIVEEQKHEEAVNYEKAIIELFLAADEDQDGELKLEEFRSLMQRADLGLVDSDILALAQQLDKDKNNIVTWREFLPLALQLVDSMEAQNTAIKERMDKAAWADDEAAALEAWYAADFEEAFDELVKKLSAASKAGGGEEDLCTKKALIAGLSDLMAPMLDNGLDGMADLDPTGGRLLRPAEVEKLAELTARGFDGERRPVCDLQVLKATALDVRFSTVKADLIEMTSSALGDYLMDRVKKRVAVEDAAGVGAGVPGAVMLKKPQLQQLLASDKALCIAPLQILSILRMAKPAPLPSTVVDPATGQPKKLATGDAVWVDCAAFVPIAAAAIEHMFDPKFLARRAQLLKRGALRPVEILHGPDHDDCEHRLAELFKTFDKDAVSVVSGVGICAWWGGFMGTPSAPFFPYF